MMDGIAQVKTLNLTGKKGLVIGIANDQSIAYGCAKHCRAYGAELAVTYLNDKAEKWVRPLAETLEAPIFMPCDVRGEGELEAVFAEIEKTWGKLDFIIHSIAFANREDLHGRVVDCSRDGFALAMDVSCHSFIRMAHLAEPLMKDGGCLMTVSFYGGRKVVEHYNVMGPVKAALESATKYMAHELGPKGIRVVALSPGPLKTRAASGIDRFDELMEQAAAKAPMHQLATIDDCGSMAAYLVSDLAKAVTGTTIFIDGGYHIVG
ncbi:MAG: enoyl-ACP reductase FabI [Solirubrobacterales bacterium]